MEPKSIENVDEASSEEEEVRTEDAPEEFSIGSYYFTDAMESVLGMGSFGCVFKGINTEDKTQVAIKRVPRDCIKWEELDIVRGLTNEFVVRVFEVLRDDQYCFVVMECCECTLFDHEQYVIEENGGKMTTENIDIVLDSLGCGYKELYLQHIIHRDLKPQNVLLKYKNGTNDRQIAVTKISDFGTSRLGRRSYTKLVGTPLYMAPEIGANMLNEVEYDYRVDMWSIGVLLYEMLAAKVPFDERALCRLFLFASNNNYAGYKPPALPAEVLPRHSFLVEKLLDVDASRRLTPLQLYECVHEKKLLNGYASCPIIQRKNGNLSWPNLREKNGISLTDENNKKQRCMYS